MRNCGDCQLCCRLLPVKSIGKKAGTRCIHQKHGKGCKIYERRPSCCRLWSCAWLTGNDTTDLRRPDRAHYVIDCMPEFIKLSDDATGEIHKVPVVQIWIDPRYPNAHEDPALRRFLLRRGAEGVLGVIRSSDEDGFVICPPNMSDDGQWHIKAGQSEEAHSVEEIFDVLERGHV
jgi:hypothetical protein